MTTVSFVEWLHNTVDLNISDPNLGQGKVESNDVMNSTFSVGTTKLELLDLHYHFIPFSINYVPYLTDDMWKFVVNISF